MFSLRQYKVDFQSIYTHTDTEFSLCLDALFEANRNTFK